MSEHRESPRAEPPPDESNRASLARGELAGMDLGMRVLSYLIAGVLVYGGLGWLGDHVWGTSFLLPTGIVLGAAGGCYVIIRRYGQVNTTGLPPRSARRTYRKADTIAAATTIAETKKAMARARTVSAETTTEGVR